MRKGRTKGEFFKTLNFLLSSHFQQFSSFLHRVKTFSLEKYYAPKCINIAARVFILHHTAVQLGSKSFLCFSFDICSMMRPGSITWFGTFTHMIKARLHFLVILPNRIVFHLFFIRSQCFKKIAQKKSDFLVFRVVELR